MVIAYVDIMVTVMMAIGHQTAHVLILLIHTEAIIRIDVPHDLDVHVIILMIVPFIRVALWTVVLHTRRTVGIIETVSVKIVTQMVTTCNDLHDVLLDLSALLS